MIDCHAHFYPPQFAPDQIPALAAAAREVGVQAIVVVPESLQDCHQVLQLAAVQPLVKPCAGLHPVQPLHGPGPDQFYTSCRSVQHVSEVVPVLDIIRAHADKLVAVGEIGLDFSPHVLEPKQQQPCSTQDSSPPQQHDGDGTDSQQQHQQPHAGTLPTAEELKEVQRAVFKQQIQLANELGLPVNVHSRSAGHHAITALVESNAQGALLHAFDGKPAYALKGAQEGYFFSVPPSIVRSDQKQRLVKALPLDRLVLETDAPALGPHKDIDNVPANIVVSAREIARIKGLSLEQVVHITTENAYKLFPRLS